MLLSKAWRESRVRFLLALSALALFSLGFLLNARRNFPPPESPLLPYAAVVWSRFYAGYAGPVFAIVALIFGLGGLQRERAAGTAGFTLALPVSRAQLLGARALVGVLELSALVLTPAVIVPVLSPPLVHQAYPVSQCLKFAALFMSWGVVWFSTGFLWSILFSGDYTAPAAAILTPFAYLVVFANLSRGGLRFRYANPFAFMSGDMDADPRAFIMGLHTGPLPWMTMAVLAIVALVLLAAASKVTKRQSF